VQAGVDFLLAGRASARGVCNGPNDACPLISWFQNHLEQSRGCLLLVQLAIMLREAASPGLLVGFAGIVAGPEHWFAAGEQVAEAVAAVAGARAADQELLGGPFANPTSAVGG
jgi:hypothetical protein